MCAEEEFSTRPRTTTLHSRACAYALGSEVLPVVLNCVIGLHGPPHDKKGKPLLLSWLGIRLQVNQQYVEGTTDLFLPGLA